jgi:hypothetical protein
MGGPSFLAVSTPAKIVLTLIAGQPIWRRRNAENLSSTISA